MPMEELEKGQLWEKEGRDGAEETSEKRWVVERYSARWAHRSGHLTVRMDGSWTEEHTGKKKFVQGYIGASKLFRGTKVTGSFHKTIQLKDSAPDRPSAYL